MTELNSASLVDGDVSEVSSGHVERHSVGLGQLLLEHLDALIARPLSRFQAFDPFPYLLVLLEQRLGRIGLSSHRI